MPMMKPMPLCPGPRPPYLENEVHCLKTRTGALEERASAADARMDAAEAATASAARLASEAMGTAAAAAAGASVQRLVTPYLATLSLRSADLPSAKRWLDSRDWAPSGAPACSVHVRSASSVRRWFDWRRDLASEFAVHVSGKYDSVHPFAVAGMSSMGMLCPAGSNPPPELVPFVPHMMVDGVNEAGVFAEVNVVPLKPDGSTGWSGTACPSAAAVYECLARFGSAAEAAAWIAASVYVPPKFAAATEYSVHFMLADASGAVWAVEDGAAREVSGSGDDAPCMSNFRLYGADGSRSAGTAAAVAPYDPLGSGVERYALLKSGSYSVQDLFFTGAYASPSPRPSEFAGLARADGTPVTLANLSEQATLDAIASALAGYDPSDASGKWWHTAHFAEYDLGSRTFSVRVREGSQSWSFGLFEKAAEGAQGGGGSQVQADWAEADSSDPAFIRNKPVPVAPDTLAPAGSFAGASEVVKYAESVFVDKLGGGVLHGFSVRGALRQSAEISVSIGGTTETYAAVFEKHVPNASGTIFQNKIDYYDVAGEYGTESKRLVITSSTRVVGGTRIVAGTRLYMFDADGESRFGSGTPSVQIESDPPSDFTATFPDGTTLSFAVTPAVPYAKTTDIVQSDWSASTGPAAILNKPTSFAPSAHKDSHKTGGSDAITPSDIGALPVYGPITTSPMGVSMGSEGTVFRFGAFDSQGRFGAVGEMIVGENGTVSFSFNGGPAKSVAFADAVAASLSAHTSATNNPHSVTKAQVGLGNVDNTSDANKPISTAVQNALEGKVDKADGKGIVTLSTDNPTNAAYADASGMLHDAALDKYAYFDSTGRLVVLEQVGGQLVERPLALYDELPYAKSSMIGTRQVMTITATTAQSVTLPIIPNTDEVLNCDIVVNGKVATADFGLTIVGGTGVDVHYPNGEGITCKSGCVTMVSCVGINGLGWLVVGCNNLKTAS